MQLKSGLQMKHLFKKNPTSNNSNVNDPENSLFFSPVTLKKTTGNFNLETQLLWINYFPRGLGRLKNKNSGTLPSLHQPLKFSYAQTFSRVLGEQAPFGLPSLTTRVRIWFCDKCEMSGSQTLESGGACRWGIYLASANVCEDHPDYINWVLWAADPASYRTEQES